MTLFRERTTNTNDTVSMTSVALNATTSTKIADAAASNTEARISFTVDNPSSQDVWIKFQAASVDNDKKGYFLPKKSSRNMDTDNIYTGEISAIAVSGTPTIYINEY